jgi:hypothetical protein
MTIADYRVPVSEAAALGQLQLTEIERRWKVLPRWDGQPSVSAKDAEEIYQEDQRRADQEARIRTKWANWSADHQHRRSRAFQAGIAAAVIPADTPGPEKYARQQAAGSRALTRYDEQHPFPTDMYRWWEEEGRHLP